MTWKCAQRKKWHLRHSQVCQWCSYLILMLSVIYYWKDAWQLGINFFFFFKLNVAQSEVTLYLRCALTIKMLSACSTNLGWWTKKNVWLFDWLNLGPLRKIYIINVCFEEVRKTCWNLKSFPPNLVFINSWAIQITEAQGMNQTLMGVLWNTPKVKTW